VGSIRRKTHVALPQYTTNSEHTFGAMEEMSQKVQNASTHILRRKNHEHVHSSRLVQGSVQRVNGGIFREGSKCKHSHSETSTRTATGQFMGQFKGAIERYMRGFDSRESSPPATGTHGDGQHTSGAMDGSSGKVQNANAHSIVLRTHTKHSLSIQRGDG